ncbi:FAD-binding oxidoreductase [Algihabitans albus]|uniref:FAD-binding oxidoreductase n=1 Tax=Algihabitans albus TaxID=2164067 RepID=UPI001F371AFD|nr:FAD-binding oxidoreductase [Algihabitans albus]
MTRSATVSANSAPAASERLLKHLTGRLGDQGLVTVPDDMAPYLVDWRGLYKGTARAVVLPRTTEEVAETVRACVAAGVPIVPQGGNTGLVGAATPASAGEAVVLNLKRLDRVRDLDPEDQTVTVEAGCVLARLQEAAAEAGLLFPLSLGAEGSCQIGGNLSTNAGGIHVLRYGNARDLVLGLEVVLPDGTVWNGLRRLRKDNTGYDLKQLFLGAEGTLGVITAATLKLFPRHGETVTCFAAVADPEAAVRLLSRLKREFGETLNACELVPRLGIDLALKYVEGSFDPLASPYPAYVLAELASARRETGLREGLETTLAEAYEAGDLLDASIATSEAQAQRLWFLREAIVEGQRLHGQQLKHDISVPVSCLPAFLAEAGTRVSALRPDVEIMAFGHLGDGNIHFNLSVPADGAADLTASQAEALTGSVHDVASEFGGSISAEHGIGQLKRAENLRRKPEIEIDLMRRLKSALDPLGLMNPGKVI